MRLFPDLATNKLLFLRFFVHFTKGLEEIDRFWNERGRTRDRLGLVYSSYSRRKKAHTASVQWRPHGESCCDVRISLDAVRPRDLGFHSGREYKANVSEFAEFLDFIRSKENTGIVSQYGFELPPSFVADPPNSRITRFTMEVGRDRALAELDMKRKDDLSWLAVIQPKGLLNFKKEPVSASYFLAPLEIAKQLGSVFLEKEQRNG